MTTQGRKKEETDSWEGRAGYRGSKSSKSLVARVARCSPQEMTEPSECPTTVTDPLNAGLFFLNESRTVFNWVATVSRMRER